MRRIIAALLGRKPSRVPQPVHRDFDAAGQNRGRHQPPTPDEIPPPPLPPEVLERVGRAVVVLERVDARGRQAGPACGFVDARGLVITNRHCVEGAAAIRLNLGGEGMFDLPTLVFESESLDVVALRGDFPADRTGGLAWADAPPHRHTPIAVVMRSSDGRLGSSPGWSGSLEFERMGNLVLQSSAPAWLGCSGSPMVDAEGRVFGVVSRLGEPAAGQARTSAHASLCSDVLALGTGEAKLFGEWSMATFGPDFAKYVGCKRALEQVMHRDSATAIQLCDEGLRIRPGDVWMTICKIWLLHRKNRKDELRAALKRFVADRPGESFPLVYKGHAAYWEQDYAAAIEAYGASLKIRPTALAWFWKGTAEWWKQDYKAAAESYEACLRLEPRHTRSWEGLAQMYQRLNTPDELARVQARRLEAHPNNPELMAELASAKLRAGEQGEHDKIIGMLRGINPYLANRAEMPPMEWSDYYT